MEQMELTAPTGKITVLAAHKWEGTIMLDVEEGCENDALVAAIAGIHMANADPTLLDPAANKEGPSPRRRPTSKAAALANWPRTGSQRWAILRKLINADMGKTRDELSVELSMSGDTVRPRVLELIQGGWVIETEHTRPTRKGNDSIVLLASKKAVDYRG